MAITQSDIKLFESAELSDADTGGGYETANEIVSGDVNNLFSNISRVDRAAGEFSVRKIFARVASAGTETYYDSHVIITDLPDESGVETFLFTTNSKSDVRTAAGTYLDAPVEYTNLYPDISTTLYIPTVNGSTTIDLVVKANGIKPKLNDVIYISEWTLYTNVTNATYVDGTGLAVEDYFDAAQTTYGYRYRITIGTTITSVDSTLSIYRTTPKTGFKVVSTSDVTAVSSNTVSVVNTTKQFVPVLTSISEHANIVGSDGVVEIPDDVHKVVICKRETSTSVSAFPMIAYQGIGFAQNTTLTIDFWNGSTLNATYNVSEDGAYTRIYGTTDYGVITVDRAVGSIAWTLGTASALVVQNSVPTKTHGSTTITGRKDTSADRTLTHVISTGYSNLAPNSFTLRYRSGGSWYQISELGGVLKGDGFGSINLTTGVVNVTLNYLPDSDVGILYEFSLNNAVTYTKHASDISNSGMMLKIPFTTTPSSIGQITISGGYLASGEVAIPLTNIETWYYYTSGIAYVYLDLINKVIYVKWLDGDVDRDASNYYFNTFRVYATDLTTLLEEYYIGSKFNNSIIDLRPPYTDGTDHLVAPQELVTSYYSNQSCLQCNTYYTVNAGTVNYQLTVKYVGEATTQTFSSLAFGSWNTCLATAPVTNSFDVYLASGGAEACQFRIYNNTTNIEYIVIKDDLGSTVLTIAQSDQLRLDGISTYNWTVTHPTRGVLSTYTGSSTPAGYTGGTIASYTLNGTPTSSLAITKEPYVYSYSIPSGTVRFQDMTSGNIFLSYILKIKTKGAMSLYEIDVTETEEEGNVINHATVDHEASITRETGYTPPTNQEFYFYAHGEVCRHISGGVVQRINATDNSWTGVGTYNGDYIEFYPIDLEYNHVVPNDSSVIMPDIFWCTEVTGYTPTAISELQAVLLTGNIVPSSVSISAIRTSDSAALSASDNGSGSLTGDFTGTVDYEAGFVDIQSAVPFNSDSITVSCSAYAYSATSASGIPFNTEIYPVDGRIKLFKNGDIVVVYESVTDTLTDPVPLSTPQSLTHANVLDIVVKDSAGTPATLVLNTHYTQDLVNGTVTITDKTGFTEPLKVTYQIEDMSVITSIDGKDVILNSAPSHTYTSAAKCSGIIFSTDLTCSTNSFHDLSTWNGTTWTDTPYTSVASASYDTTNYPVVLTNDSTIDERWCLKFVSTTTVDIYGERLGLIASAQAIGSTIAPLNPATSLPYFSINSAGWGSGWNTGEAVRFNTVAPTIPLWVVRSTQAGANYSGVNDSTSIQVRGDI